MGLWMEQLAFNCETTSYGSNLTTRWWIPKADAIDKILIVGLYSAMLLVAGPKKIPPDPTNLPMGDKMTQREEGMF